MNDTVVAIAQFKIARGVDEETFLKASDAVQSLLNMTRGFVKRELIKTPDGLNWMDIVKWRSHAEAEQAASTAMKDPTCMKFLALIDRSSIKKQHMELTRSYD